MRIPSKCDKIPTMPESQCTACKARLYDELIDGLKKQELTHHQSSEKVDVFHTMGKDLMTKKHGCNVFSVYDDQGVYIGVRIYAHGKYSYSM